VRPLGGEVIEGGIVPILKTSRNFLIRYSTFDIGNSPHAQLHHKNHNNQIIHSSDSIVVPRDSAPLQNSFMRQGSSPPPPVHSVHPSRPTKHARAVRGSAVGLPNNVYPDLAFLWQTGTLAYFIHGLKAVAIDERFSIDVI
jgi:hypothetical protein